MSSLVDATFRTLLYRFQRGGTQADTTHRPEQDNYRWIFQVTEAARPKAGKLIVEVGLLSKNVYKIGDTVQITVSGLVGTVPSETFQPITGNSPSVDVIEAFVRSSLAGKLDQSPAPAPVPVESRSLPPEPVLATVVETPPPPRPRKRDGGFKHPQKKSGPEPEA